ncbi:MAG: acyltransferase family protein [Candidatus Thiodiazotropha sp.]
MRNRIDLIDVAKGMSILLVAFHHSQLASQYSGLSSAMGLFRMPLFFFLSGVFFKALAPPGEFIAHKTQALLKPYFATLGLLLLTTILLGRDGVLGEAFGILYGTGDTIRWTPMWFLTMLWVLFMGSYLLVRWLRLDAGSAMLQSLVLIVMLLVGVVWMDLFRGAEVRLFNQTYILPGLPFNLDLIFISMAYFMLGHFLSGRVKAFAPNPWLLTGMMVVFFSIVLFSDAAVDLNRRIYREPVLATLGALSGIYLVLTSAYLISQVSRIKTFFKAFGSASLFILIFHYVLMAKLQSGFDHWVSADWILLTATISYAFSVSFPLLIKRVIERNRFLRPLYFPVKHAQPGNPVRADSVPADKSPSG